MMVLIFMMRGGMTYCCVLINGKNNEMNKKFIDIELNRVSFLDDRFYAIDVDGEIIYYPSVTSVLNLYPKGIAFDQWQRDVGNSASLIAERAAVSGKKVHDGVERLISGEEITWDDNVYNLIEWQGILKYKEFNERFSPSVIAVETVVCSHEHRYAGQTDIICEIDGERWLLDTKFTNAIHETNFFQLAAYRMGWEEAHPDLPIHKMGILWLKAQTRTDGKPGTMQGKGWQVVLPKESHERLFEMFKKTLDIYYYETPNPAPKNVILPFKVKL